ncbi:hypothetical protein DFH06DRAFT_1331541 [Mycena polygramma]|nr:hypothetical protein DFH06DRAFT_1331541 [Mycena polygramma]
MDYRISRVIAYLRTTNDLECVAWADQLNFLAGAEDGLQTRTVLATMSSDRLLETTLVSRKHYELVASFLDFLCNNEPDEDELSDDGAEHPRGTCTLCFHVYIYQKNKKWYLRLIFWLAV